MPPFPNARQSEGSKLAADSPMALKVKALAMIFEVQQDLCPQHLLPLIILLHTRPLCLSPSFPFSEKFSKVQFPCLPPEAHAHLHLRPIKPSPFSMSFLKFQLLLSTKVPGLGLSGVPHWGQYAPG